MVFCDQFRDEIKILLAEQYKSDPTAFISPFVDRVFEQRFEQVGFVKDEIFVGWIDHSMLDLIAEELRTKILLRILPDLRCREPIEIKRVKFREFAYFV